MIFHIDATFTINAEDETDAKARLLYALTHSNLVSPTNGITVLPGFLVYPFAKESSQ